MTKQFAQVNLDEFWRDDVDDMVNALEFLKPHFGNIETPPPSPPSDVRLTVQHIDLDFDPDLESKRYVRFNESNDVSFDVDIPELSDSECDWSF
nr:unnamed protein product [Callosobruchus chinensis]